MPRIFINWIRRPDVSSSIVTVIGFGKSSHLISFRARLKRLRSFQMNKHTTILQRSNIWKIDNFPSSEQQQEKNNSRHGCLWKKQRESKKRRTRQVKNKITNHTFDWARLRFPFNRNKILSIKLLQFTFHFMQSFIVESGDIAQQLGRIKKKVLNWAEMMWKSFLFG